MTEQDRSAAVAPGRRITLAARKMRLLTGVREQTLDVIPAERTRYTALAAVMLCTATFGGFSMFFALSEIMGSPEIWFIPLAIFWSVFVLCVDCWLVSSSAGSRWRARASVLLPRLVVAMFIGGFIAEPLVLRVFQTAIVSQVRDQRQQAIDELRTGLIACNPVPGAPAVTPPGGSCRGMYLGVAGPSAAAVASLDSLGRQAATLHAQISQETGQMLQLEGKVNAECNGNSGNGLTGIRGDGPACEKDQQDVVQYDASHPINAQSTELQGLNQRITKLQDTVSSDQTSYRDELAHAVTARLAEETAPGSPIGMGERFEALAHLSLSSGFIGVASWFVRIFFVLIDCLPVLVKFISGTTPYDRLADTETGSAERIFARKAGAREAAADEEISVAMHEARSQAARKKREIDLDLRRHDAEQEARKDVAVDELWRRKLAARRLTPEPSDEGGRSYPHAQKNYRSAQENGKDPLRGGERVP